MSSGRSGGQRENIRRGWRRVSGGRGTLGGASQRAQEERQPGAIIHGTITHSPHNKHVLSMCWAPDICQALDTNGGDIRLLEPGPLSPLHPRRWAVCPSGSLSPPTHASLPPGESSFFETNTWRHFLLKNDHSPSSSGSVSGPTGHPKGRAKERSPELRAMAS